MDIYDGLYDWTDNVSYSGSGNPIPTNKKFSPGAVTVANLNDTNGSGAGIGNAGVDADENNVVATDIGRNEIDLIKLVLRKKNDIGSLSGNVILSKTSGSVRLWTSPSKGTEVDISDPINIPANQLPRTFYIEATSPSDELQDIEFTASYNGSEDKVRATAIWVTKTNHWLDRTSTPVPGSQLGALSNLKGTIVNQVNTNKAADGSLYGFGEFRQQNLPWDMTSGNKKIGGRILMEWQVFPNGADQIASFDVTRQRKTRTWSIDYAQQSFTQSNGSTNFPFEIDLPNEPEDSEDVEEPNDDGSGTTENRKPENDFLYSWDAPSIFKVFNNNGVSEDELAYRVSKNWFKEFVRVGTKSGGFPNADIFDDSGLMGSRASEKFDWHCTYYTRKDENYRMTLDTENLSFAFPKMMLQGQDADNSLYDIEISLDPNISYEVGDFSIVYWGVDNNEKMLDVYRIDDQSFPYPVTEKNYTISANETEWNIEIDGVSVKLTEQNVEENDLVFILLTTFKTNNNAKDNKLDTGEYTNFSR